MAILPEDALILIAGGGGKTGGRIAARLQAAGRRVRLASRSTTPRFDWADPSSWDAALVDVAAVYAAYQPDLAAPGALDTVTAFFEQARKAGVRRIVLLSGRGEPEAQAAEDSLKAAGVEWTVIRAAWFMQNFSEAFLLDPILAGDAVLPTGTAAEPFVDVEDIADVAAAALAGDGHAGRLYEMTGPEALPFEAAMGMIGAATGRDIAISFVSPQRYETLLREAGLPDIEVKLFTYLFTDILDGRNTPVADGISVALGRRPGSFASYVARAAATGVWAERASAA